MCAPGRAGGGRGEGGCRIRGFRFVFWEKGYLIVYFLPAPPRKDDWRRRRQDVAVLPSVI